MNNFNTINKKADWSWEGNIMKSLRIIGAILGTIGMISMFSCGGSSYLTEFPGDGENTNVTTIVAGGLAGGSTENTILSKDIELPPLDGTTGGSGDAYLDAGLHECFFEPPAISSTGLVTIKATEAECVGITNCGWCSATQVGYPNCEVTCTLNTAASEDFIGEYLEMTYVDWAILYSDAGGSSGGALRGEGEALNSPTLGSHLFDSTSRAFIITDGGLTLDQVTPLTDVQSIDKFDYTMAITDMILDPTASSHNAALPDNTAWVDIETRVIAQIPLDELALPEGVANMDAGLYASNWGFWHDAANEQDIMAFVEMFNQTLEFMDADIVSYANCTTAGENLGGEVVCLGMDTSRTADGIAELLAVDTASGSAIMTYSEVILSSAECAALNGTLGSEIDAANLPDICFPNSFADVYDQNPLVGPLSGLTLDMYDPATVGGDNITFAEAGVDHICTIDEASTNNGDGCHPEDTLGEWSTCMPYLINDVEPAPDGCLFLCFDYRGIDDPESDPPDKSPWAQYLDDMTGEGIPVDQTICEANNGTWLEMDPDVWMCMPNQLMACVEDPPEIYTRDDAYVAGTDESALAAMSTMFSTGSDAESNGAADFIAGVDKTMYEYAEDCNTAGKGYLLAAIPYERNLNGSNANDAVNDTCYNVMQRFIDEVATPFEVTDLGTDKPLTGYNLSIDFKDHGLATQGLAIRILDGTNGGSGTPAFEDISGSYIQGDGTPIPAAGLTYDGVSQWFDVPDIRVSLQRNPLLPVGGGEGDWMSVYTDDGLPKGDEASIKVSTYLDFHRINEANLFSPTPENIYLMYIDLMAPIDADGNDAGFGCDFEQQFVIDGTCAADLP